MTTGKIGVAVITCNRQRFFDQCIASIPPADTLVVVNDGKPYPASAYPDKVDKVVQHPRNFNVATAKNNAIRELLATGCNHIFLCEDDIVVTDPSVYDKYIAASTASGIQHLNYGGHGNGNRDKDGTVTPRDSVDYGDGVKVDFYRNCLGAWSYYTAKCISAAGLMDERFHNAMEHVDHTYNIIRKGMHPPFWWFADAGDSWTMLRDIEDNHGGSEIRRDQVQWEHNLRNAFALFMHKHKHFPTQVPMTPDDDVLFALEQIESNYGNNDPNKAPVHP